MINRSPSFGFHYLPCNFVDPIMACIVLFETFLITEISWSQPHLNALRAFEACIVLRVHTYLGWRFERVS